MRLRSLLFVPGDRADRMEKALSSGADALILDLEDSVLSLAKPTARQAVARFLARPRTLPVFVRVNALGAEIDADLAAVVPHGPDGIVLPKAEGAASLADVDRRLAALGDKRARILPIATETPKAIFALGSYGGVTPRLCGLSWGAEDLPAAIGATTAREADGRFTQPYEIVRALTLFGAHAAQVPAIETVYPAFRDEAGLAAYAVRGKRDGFSGMLAIHPAQVAVINAAFTPSLDEIAWAQRVVAAFAQNAGAGTIELDGRMLDAPHLKLAQTLLAQPRS
jgi:citrate lyase subunit beta/citryl-CoA lyase